MEDIRQSLIGIEKKFNHYFKPSSSLNDVLLANENGDEVNVICLSAMTFDKVLTEAIKGLEHYEMRCLWEITRVKRPGTCVHFFSKYKVDDQATKHFFDVFAFSEEERGRVYFYSVEEILNTKILPEDLSDYVVNQPMVSEVFSKISNRKNSYLECFVLSPKEFNLASNFKLPTWWDHKDLDFYKTKSGNRVILKGVTSVPKGVENLYSFNDVSNALRDLIASTGKRKFVIKLNDGVSGDGNGFIKIDDKKNIEKCLMSIDFVSPKMNFHKFFSELSRIGGIVEEFIEGKNKRSPSVQVYLKPDGDFEVISSHEQVLDETGSRFLGADFPADTDHREQIIHEANKVAKRLMDLQLFGIVGLDFLTVRNNLNQIETFLIEMNIRKGGTTHPYWTAKTALNAETCKISGKLRRGDKHWVYRSNDNIIHQGHGERSLSDLLNKVKSANLIFCPVRKSGVIFHMLNCWEPVGKCGAVFVANTHDQVLELESKVVNLIT